MSNSTDPALQPLRKTDAEWREIVPVPAYHVLVREGTERSGTSPLNLEKREGTYLCAACLLPLFTSDARFDSGTVCPTFFQSIHGHVETKRDYKLVRPRTEYHCARCGGPPGHVFPDGPPPTGKRFCNNGVALRCVPAGEALPEPRA
ncbi:MAG TPA: peptide-methionine (R)-S-oxide reductase [Longimicrobium sp.]|jgi:peptide-methionine (R)-S-oxide reductase